MNKAGHERSIGGTNLWTLVGLLGLFLALTYAHAFAGAAPGIKVVGNQIVTTTAGTLGVQSVSANQAVVLRGVNITGSEYECLQGDSVWDTIPSAETTAAYQAVVNAMLAWHVNVVRLPLNEDCWLDVPTSTPPPAATSGANYVNAIASFIQVANASGLIAEVNLHVGAGPQLVKKGSKNIDSYPVMDTNYSGSFWQSVATKFKNNPSVIFNLTNEPEITSWSCYLNGGCSTKGFTSPNGKSNYWTVLGTQSVVTTIRNAGANNPIIIAGLDYSNQLNNWLSYVPNDPQKQIVAGVHIYFDGLDCEASSCWTSVFGKIQTAGYPVVVDETGEFDTIGSGGCGSGSEQGLTAWADTQAPQVGYWFWAFTYVDYSSGSCANGPDLLENAYTPWPNYGSFVEAHLQSVQ
jgi:hypothetical protein